MKNHSNSELMAVYTKLVKASDSRVWANIWADTPQELSDFVMASSWSQESLLKLLLPTKVEPQVIIRRKVRF